MAKTTALPPKIEEPLARKNDVAREVLVAVSEVVGRELVAAQAHAKAAQQRAAEADLRVTELREKLDKLREALS